MIDREQLRAAGRAAHAHANALERQIETTHPGVWQTLDHLRRQRPMPWPDWCLLPMAAPATMVSGYGRPRYPQLIAAMSALYAWRYTRSVYLIEPALLDRLLSQVPDAIGVDDLAGLPQWCVYIAEPDQAGAITGGVWMHLEHDANTGRPELRLLLDTDPALGLEGLLPLPVYLDRETVTEALADFRATAAASIGGRTGADVRGGDLDATVAQLAERVDGYLALARYLARPEADIRSLTGTSARPRRYRSPVRDREVWLVGDHGVDA